MDDDILDLTSSDSEPDFFSSQARERADRKAATRGINGMDDVGVVHGAHNQRGNNNAPGFFHTVQKGNGKSNTTPAPSGSQKTNGTRMPQKKGKTPPSADVIDLTDSEPEIQVMQGLVAPTRRKMKKVGNAVAGPSRIRDEDGLGGSQRRGGVNGLQDGRAGSGSGLNGGGSAEGGGDGDGSGLKRKQPLFLAGSEDEWGEEDFLDERMGERAAKKGRVGDANLHLQNGHRGDGRERDVVGVDVDMDQRQYPAWEGFDYGLLEDNDMYVPLDDERERRRAQEFVGERLPQQPQPQPPAPNLQYQPPEQPQPVPQQAQPIPDPIPQQAPVPAPQPQAQPAPQPDPQPQAPAQPPSKDDIIAQVLSIIPDVQPEHLSGLVDRNIAQFGERTSELVIGMLFEDAAYPKVERRGVKRGGDEEKGKEKEREEKRQKVDYKSLDRDVPGGGYEGLALATLQLYFAHIPRLYLQDQLQAHRGLYAPTYLALLAAEKRYETQPRLKKPYEKGIYKPKKGGKGKGKTKAGARNAAPVYGHAHVHYGVEIPESDEEGGGRVDAIQADEDVQRRFDEELGWLEGYLAGGEEGEGVNGGGDKDEGGGEGDVIGKGKGKEKAVDDAGEGGEGGEGEAEIECGCCYCEYPFSQMVQCPEAHLFCKGCLTTYASNQLSSLSCVINCMSSSPACALPFPASELRRALPENLLKLYDRVTQQDEIAKAGLEGLEECPFCEWKCVMEVSVEQEKLFRCGNEDGGCGVTSCRMCKKLDHLPKSCQEVEEDKVLDGRHAIEEAMTAALMRNCPNCKKAFIKEQGCNKMTCPHCRTLSCYICRQVIRGYDHFNQMPNQPGPSRKSGKCSLWDKVEERHAEEVKAAHDKAMEKYREEHPDVETDALKVDLPPAPPPPPQPPVLPPIHHLPIRGRRGRGRGPAGAMFPAHPGLVQAPIPNPVQPPVVPPAQGRRGRRGQGAIVNPPAPPPPQPAHQVPLVYNPGPLAANNPAIAHLIPPVAPPAIPQQHNFGFAMGFQGLYEQQMQLQMEHQRLQREQQQQRAQQQHQWQREQQQVAAMHMRAMEQQRRDMERQRLAQQEQRLRETQETQERAREHQRRMQEQQRERGRMAAERARTMAREVLQQRHQRQAMGMQGPGAQLGQMHQHQVPHQLHHQHQAQHQHQHIHHPQLHQHHVQQAQVVAQPQAQIQHYQQLAQQARMTRAQAAAAAAALPAQGQGQGVLRRA